MTNTFSPEESAARAMLLLHSKSPLDAIETMNAVRDATAQVFANNPDPSDAQLDAAVQHAIQSLGYVTDLATLRDMHEAMSARHAGLWSGSYTVVDSLGDVHLLTIGSAGMRLLLGCMDEAFDVPSEGEAYADRRIRVTNSLVTADLQLSTSADDLEDPSADDLTALADSFQVFVTGTLTVKSDGRGERTLRGKRGVSTPAGVFAERGEDPAFLWDGSYQLRYTDTDDWEFHDDLLRITCDESGALSLALGDRKASDVSYSNSVIGCSFEFTPGTTTKATLQMSITSGGSRKFYLWFDTTGQARTLTGYATRLVDKATLWRKPGAPGPVRAQASDVSAVKDIRSGHFFDTAYDALVPASDLVADASASGALAPADLLVGTTLKLDAMQNVTGFGMEETDSAGNSTGRIVLFQAKAASGAAAEIRFPAKSRAKGFQALDEARHVMPGALNAQIGILLDTSCELPALVETDFYEVRMSATGLRGPLASGVRFALAIDDLNQPRLLSLQQPESKDTKPPAKNAELGIGPDADVKKAVPDFSKASVLVRGATGETQNVGHKDYYFSVLPVNTSGWVQATRSIYTAMEDGTHVKQGDSVDLLIPLLLHVPIEMDSRDALELSGDQWVPASRGKKYTGRITAHYGQQPFTWRVLEGTLPAGLQWDQNLAAQTDLSEAGLLSFGVSGSISDSEDPGNTYQPRIRVMSDKSCVMKPAHAAPQIVIAEPDLENRGAWEVSNAIVTAVSALISVASMIVAVLAFTRDVKSDKKKKASDSSISLDDLSKNKMKDFSTTLERLTDTVEKLEKAQDYSQKLEARLKATETMTADLTKTIDRLRAELKDARSKGDQSSVDILEKKVDVAKDRRERAEKDSHDARKQKDQKDEKASRKEGE